MENREGMEQGVHEKLKTKKPEGALPLSGIPTIAKRGENFEMQTAEPWRHEGVAQDRNAVCSTTDNFGNVGVNR